MKPAPKVPPSPRRLAASPHVLEGVALLGAAAAARGAAAAVTTETVGPAPAAAGAGLAAPVEALAAAMGQHCDHDDQRPLRSQLLQRADERRHYQLLLPLASGVVRRSCNDCNERPIANEGSTAGSAQRHC